MKCAFCKEVERLEFIPMYGLTICKSCIDSKIFQTISSYECNFCKKDLTESSVMLYGIKMCLDCYDKQKLYLQRSMKK